MMILRYHIFAVIVEYPVFSMFINLIMRLFTSIFNLQHSVKMQVEHDIDHLKVVLTGKTWAVIRDHLPEVISKVSRRCLMVSNIINFFFKICIKMIANTKKHCCFIKQNMICMFIVAWCLWNSFSSNGTRAKSSICRNFTETWVNLHYI